MSLERSDLVIVSNRLPVDISLDESGEVSWQRSPAGGLVTALEPVVRSNRSAWVGWPGSNDIDPPAFDADGIIIVPVPVSTEEFENYYEGFSNGTLWPLYHDVIAAPSFHRHWWDDYVKVNHRFAQAAADVASDGAVVWVQDYQLQLVPKMLRELRSDLKIGFFNHIPFPPVELFKQLPWRRQILEGLLGADLVGFQRASGASNFLRAVRNVLGAQTRGQLVSVSSGKGLQQRTVRAGHFPISIDSNRVDRMARSPEIKKRAAEIRKELGDPEIMFLGVDRLDYTKGIRHRIKAYGELLADGEFLPPQATFVQVASPSRENVEAYQQLRDEVEVLVTRINGDYGELGQPAIHYLHHSYPPEEMVPMFAAADIMLVTALRDGMNLVAKEYVAARTDESGALVLSEFTGAADELKRGAVMVNPHDIDGLKEAMRKAASMPPIEAKRRMRRMRRQVLENDVEKWSRSFLTALSDVSGDSLRWLQTLDDNPMREDAE